MPTLAVSLRLRKLRRRFGMTASRVVVRRYLPWQWLLLLGMSFFLLLSAAIWLVVQRNEVGVVGQELESLKRQIDEQRDELDLLRSTTGTRQNLANIERASQQQLLMRIDGLERENVALKEDIRLFERLIPVVGEAGEVRVENFRVIRELGLRYRYRLLLAFQPAKHSPEFRGRLELRVTFQQGGKEMQLLLPEKRDLAGEYQLEIKHFLRREGGFELPTGAVLKLVEARILQGDSLKFRRLAQL